MEGLIQYISRIVLFLILGETQGSEDSKSELQNGKQV